jgi:hypothetical protein
VLPEVGDRLLDAAAAGHSRLGTLYRKHEAAASAVGEGISERLRRRIGSDASSQVVRDLKHPLLGVEFDVDLHLVAGRYPGGLSVRRSAES